jgi:hypothetical protein
MYGKGVFLPSNGMEFRFFAKQMYGKRPLSQSKTAF